MSTDGFTFQHSRAHPLKRNCAFTWRNELFWVVAREWELWSHLLSLRCCSSAADPLHPPALPSLAFSFLQSFQFLWIFSPRQIYFFYGLARELSSPPDWELRGARLAKWSASEAVSDSCRAALLQSRLILCNIVWSHFSLFFKGDKISFLLNLQTPGNY